MKVAKCKTTLLVLDAIETYWLEHRFSPSIRDIMEITGITSTSVVRYHLLLLERRGCITRVPTIPRSICFITKEYL